MPRRWPSLDCNTAEPTLERGVSGEQRTPLGVIHLTRFGLLDELAQDAGQGHGVFQMGKMSARRQRTKMAVGNRLVRAASMLQRNRVVALAPHDHRGHRLQQIETVGGADALSTYVDHRT